MTNALVLYMPVEFCLPLMPTIRAHCMDAERKLVDDVVDEIDGALLVMPLIDLQRTNSSGIVDRSVLIPAKLAPFLADQSQELDIDLDVMTWYLFGIPSRVERTTAYLPR